jgi:hypothetical protein
MTTTSSPREIARFLRTLRVATQTALALDDLVGGRGEMRRTTTFQALAASGADGWRFPAEGLVSADGLLLAQLSAGEPPSALVLQAQGAVGLATYAGRRVLLRFTPAGEFEGVFDRDGRLEVPSDGGAIDLAGLAAFDIETLDDAP